jgi:hypothetical protein
MPDRLRLPGIYPRGRPIANLDTSGGHSANLPHARERGDRPSASRLRTSSRKVPVARNNYGFEKRQRELSKEKKKEEKRQRKMERKGADQDADAETQSDEQSPEAAPDA